MPLHKVTTEEETKMLAATLAASAKLGDVFLLHGPLGAGKSTFARAFIQSLCGNNTDVPSPTFTIVQIYDAPKGPLWHFDLYRLEHPDEIFETGFEDALHDITLVEWPERLGPHTPPNAKHIRITPLNETSRKIEIDD